MLQEKLYDVVIVGAGFAGSIVAAKIAKEGVNPSNGEKLKIALIEGGHYHDRKGKPKWGYGIPLRRQMFTHIPQDTAVQLTPDPRAANNCRAESCCIFYLAAI